MPTQTYPARLHVLLASQAPQALIIRRGPAKQVATIGWNRKTDTFTLGQWLKGRIYEHECDLSPDGKYFLYSAIDHKGKQTWTALSRAPYLKALDFYTKDFPVISGGLFTSNKTYCICAEHFNSYQYKKSNLLVSINNQIQPSSYQEEVSATIEHRLTKNGWKKEQIETIPNKHTSDAIYSKRINDHWQLIKLNHYNYLEHLPGKGSFYETHQLLNTKTDERIDLPYWEWADIDRHRLVWAEQGKLMAGTVNNKGLTNIKELFNFNDMKFEATIAPY